MTDFLQQARIAAVHPEDASVDIVMVRDGSRYVNVQVLGNFASTNTGRIDLPDVTATDDKFSLTQTTDRDMLAVVGFLAPGLPVVVGFLFPQVNQVLFSDANRRVDRHASDVYETIDKDGNYEWRHPSGTYLRVATSNAHEDLTGKDYDGNWKIAKNTDKQVHWHLSLQNGGAEKARINIDPSGNIDVYNAGDLTWHTVGAGTVNIDGNLTATVGGSAQVNVSGTTKVVSGGAAEIQAPSVKINSPTTLVTGTLTVQGLLTYQAGMAGSGGSGSSATISGNVSVTGNITSTGGEVTAGTIGLKAHHHTAQGSTAATTAAQA